MARQAVVVTYEIEPGQTDALLALLRDHVAKTRAAEPGCLQFDILRPHDETEVVRLYEVYADEAAFESHNRSAQLAAYKAASAPFLRRRSIAWCTVEAPSPVAAGREE